MTDTRAVQQSIHAYLDETDQEKKQLELYDVLTFTYKMDSELNLLDLESKQLYNRSLSPLPTYTADFVVAASQLSSSYALNGKELTDVAKNLKSNIDILVKTLDNTSMQDFEKIKSYSKNSSQFTNY